MSEAESDHRGLIPALIWRSGGRHSRSDALRPTAPHDETLAVDGSRPEGSLQDSRILTRLDAIEATLLNLQSSGIQTRNQLEACITEVTGAVAELHRSVRQAKESSTSQERVLAALEALESRMIRTEKGLVRTLEYFQQKLNEGVRRP